MSISDLKGNKRLENESYEEYRDRRIKERHFLNWYLRGRLIWNSATQGTYVRQH